MGMECIACNGTGEVEVTVERKTTLLPLGDGVKTAPPAVAIALELPADPVTAALAEVTNTNNTITAHLATARELAERYCGVVWPVATTKGMDEARKARAALRDQGRYPIQALKKEGSKLLGTMRAQFNARCDEVILEIEGYERPIDEIITAEEQRKENERAEREAAETRRRQGHIDAIAAMHRMVTEASGLDSAGVESAISSALQIVVDEGYEEFQGQAQQARDEALRQLQGLLVAARAEEAELEETRRAQAELRAAQERLATQQREQAEREEATRLQQEQAAAALAAEREQFERDKAELAAQKEQQARALAEHAAEVQRRLDQIAKVMQTWSGADPPAAILGRLDAMGEESYAWGDRASEAAALIQRAQAHLREAHAAALAREVEEARRQQDARIQELIDNIRGMGENATLAVQAGSADVGQLRETMAKLDASERIDVDFGGRMNEFLDVRDAAIKATLNAILNTDERDRLQSEEAERQRQQREDEFAAKAMADAKRWHAEDLYAMLREAVSFGMAPGIHDRARDLLLKINPSEKFEE